jgi:siroheme synthase-like protein
MSAYPLTLEGAEIAALIVGGGRVATRKALALLEAGARVRVLAPTISSELERIAAESDRLTLAYAAYAAGEIGGATLIIAATDDAALNASIARDARAKNRLVNVVDSPDLGNCTAPAVLRSGELVVAVNAGGVPAAAKRIRDVLTTKLDSRYATAVERLATLRRELIDTGRRARWLEASDALIGDDFCEQVESGRFTASLDRWR